MAVESQVADGWQSMLGVVAAKQLESLKLTVTLGMLGVVVSHVSDLLILHWETWVRNRIPELH